MEIKIFYGAENAHKARGLGVVVDVFRAFSTACYAFDKGIEKIIPVKSLDEAYRIKQENPDFILMGEQHGQVPAGFDLGNSPFELDKTQINLKGKTAVHVTTMGTRGLKSAVNCDLVLTGAFVNALAVARFILKHQPEMVSIICTGTDPKKQPIDEDHLCALYLVDLLNHKNPDFDLIIDDLKQGGFANHFFDPQITSHPKEDFFYCTRLNIFDFVLKLKADGFLRKEEFGGT